MARPKSPNKPYSTREKDYITRVAGKVPISVIATALHRTESGIKQWAAAHGIKLRVPYSLLCRHWPENAERIVRGSSNEDNETAMQKR